MANYLKRSDIIFVPLGAVETTASCPAIAITYHRWGVDGDGGRARCIVHAGSGLVVSRHHDIAQATVNISPHRTRFSEGSREIAVASGFQADRSTSRWAKGRAINGGDAGPGIL